MHIHNRWSYLVCSTITQATKQQNCYNLEEIEEHYTKLYRYMRDLMLFFTFILLKEEQNIHYAGETRLHQGANKSVLENQWNMSVQGYHTCSGDMRHLMYGDTQAKQIEHQRGTGMNEWNGWSWIEGWMRSDLCPGWSLINKENQVLPLQKTCIHQYIYYQIPV